QKGCHARPSLAESGLRRAAVLQSRNQRELARRHRSDCSRSSRAAPPPDNRRERRLSTSPQGGGEKGWPAPTERRAPDRMTTLLSLSGISKTFDNGVEAIACLDLNVAE